MRSAQIKLIAKLGRAGGARRSLRLVQGGACAGAVARAGRRDERAASPCFWIAGNRRFDRYTPGDVGLDDDLEQRQGGCSAGLTGPLIRWHQLGRTLKTQ